MMSVLPVLPVPQHGMVLLLLLLLALVVSRRRCDMSVSVWAECVCV